MTSEYSLNPIAVVRSPFSDKFGVPRQPRLTNAVSHIKLIGKANNELAVRDITEHSHIWVLFLFHQNIEQGWKPSVRPPRLGGNAKTGVFATRSSFRPNHIGMSAVKLVGCEKIDQHWQLIVTGLDLVNGTPVVDIKPYIPYSDQIPEASSNFYPQPPELTPVGFSKLAEQQIINVEHKYPELKQLIIEVLQQDPRPSYKKHKEDDREYGICLYDLDIKWRKTNSSIEVTEIKANPS